MNQNQDIAISFEDLFRFIWRGLPIALAVALLAGGIAYFQARNVQRFYSARATVLVAQGNLSLGDLGASVVTAPNLDISTYRAALLTTPVLTDALTILDGDAAGQRNPESLRNGLVFRPEEGRNSSLIHLDVVNPSAERAASVANALAEALVRWGRGLASDNLATAVSVIRGQIDTLDAQIAGGGDAEQIAVLRTMRAEQVTRLTQAEALSNSVVGRMRILQPAQVPRAPLPLQTTRNTALAALLGLVLSYGLLLLRASLDTRLKSSDDLASATNLPILAEFPQQSSKSYRLPREISSYLRTNLLFATAEAHPKVFLVTSAAEAEGKSSVALSLAASFALNKYRTLLVDADLRKPSLGRICNANPMLHHSLQKHLEHPHEDQGRYTPATFPVSATENLDLVPSFETAPSPAELLSYGFHTCLEKWQEAYDVIIIDTPPVLPVTDALIIAPLCTGTVLVASTKQTKRRQVQEAVDILQRFGFGVRILGVVATMVSKQKASGGLRTYGYDPGYDEPEASKAPLPARVAEGKRSNPKNLT
jgi:capsular exopolysaccharide synthesis family protein